MYNNYNPYYYSNNYMPPRVDPQPVQAPQTNLYNKPVANLQGKSVDSLDVVKAMDIPLDGSISYFPLVDGTAIITKQLQQDGTSKTVVYKPIENEKETVLPKYITEDDLNTAIKKINIPDVKDIKDDLKTLKRQIRDITEDLKDKKEV